MIVDKLKSIAQSLGFIWDYGSESWQNLNDFEDDTNKDGLLPEPLAADTEGDQQVYMMLLYKDADKKFDAFNNVISVAYSGEIILAVKSLLNQRDYNFKYEYRIKQVESKTESVLNQITDCEGLYVESWKEVEVSNAFDTNVDGLKISFRIRNELND
jgi:hypothetical protein